MDKQHGHIIDYCTVIKRNDTHKNRDTVPHSSDCILYGFIYDKLAKGNHREKGRGRVDHLIQRSSGEYLETELVPILIVVANISSCFFLLVNYTLKTEMLSYKENKF